MRDASQLPNHLPRCGEWIGALVTFPSYVTGEGEPYKPIAVMWLEPEADCIVDSQLVRPEEALPRAAGLFHLATRAPLAGEPRKPLRVRVADEALAHALRGSLGDVELVVAPTPEIDEVIASMTAHFAGRDREDAEHITYLGPDLEPADLAHLFRAVARLYRAQPWAKIPPDGFVAVECERLGIAEGALCIVGQQGESFGFSLFRSVEEAAQFWEAAASGERDKIPPHFMVVFDDRRELPDVLVRQIAQHGWEVAGPRAYPSFVAIDDELVARGLTLEEHVGMTGIVTALAELVEREPQLGHAWQTGERVGWSGRIETARGDVDVEVWAPLWVGGDAGASAANDDEPERWESVVDPDGVLDHDLFEDHFAALMARFEETPECTEESLPIAEMLVEYAAMQFGVTIVGLTPDEMKKLLFELIPNKVTIEAEAAPLIVATMRGLLTLAERELGSTTATKCLAQLGPSAVDRLARELADERNFGMAKKLFVQGRRAGYDMTSEAGISAFVASVNRSAGAPKPKGKRPAAQSKASRKPKRAATARAKAKPATKAKAKAASTPKKKR